MSKKHRRQPMITEKSRSIWNYGAGRAEVTEIEFGARGRKAYVVDGILKSAEMRKVYREFAKLPYRLNDSDRKDTYHVRHFACQFEESDWEKTHLRIFETFARGLLDKKKQVNKDTVRIYANLNLFGDFQFAHDDSNVWTALAFVNDEWNLDWGGELLLYGDDAHTLAYAILPVPGRLVIFDGLIPHRGGVPSKHCLGPRISLAIKMSR